MSDESRRQDSPYGTLVEGAEERAREDLKKVHRQIAIRSILVFFLTGFVGLLLLTMIGLLGESIWDKNNTSEYVRWCDGNYYSRKYSNLYTELTLYDLYDMEVYGVYWELMEGYLDYKTYLQWVEARDRGIVLETAEGDSGALIEAKVEEYRQKVLDNAANCRYEGNRFDLEQWAAEIAGN